LTFLKTKFKYDRFYKDPGPKVFKTGGNGEIQGPTDRVAGEEDKEQGVILSQ